MPHELFSAPDSSGEIVGAALRKLDVSPQAIELRVDATATRLAVDAILVASTSNALRRLHFYYDVWFMDGTDGDNGLEIIGLPVGWKEAVTFLDGTTGNNGLQVWIPFHWGDDEAVVFAETLFKANWAINNTEFVTLADYAVKYVLDFHWTDAAKFSDLSVAWTGVYPWAESVAIGETMTAIGGNTVALRESVTISETFSGGPAFIFGDAVYMQEWWTYVMDFQVQPESVTWVDAVVVSEVAATDARPGAFIPGSALLGSPQ